MTRSARRAPLPLFLLLVSVAGLSCAPEPDDDDTTSEPPTEEPTPEESLEPFPLPVLVLLDGEPAAGVSLGQGGLPDRWETDDDGLAEVVIDPSLDAEHWVVASHPDARQNGAEVPEDAADGLAEPVRIELTRFDPSDNPDYEFRDPGIPGEAGTTAQCNHCHQTIADFWGASPHRTTASNPTVQDLYAGVRSDLDTEGGCAEAGGDWRVGLEPGTGAAVGRCYLGDGVLPALNLDCGDTEPCDGVATEFGACADCHAPGIDGQLGGRDLLDATGFAYTSGVHCDVCHRIESIDLEAEPGVAGRLHLVRPSEPGGFGQPFLPLVFGPFDDVPTGVMGAVARPHFHEAILCAGCHEQEQPVLLPGEVADPSRWPDGRLPIHTTYSEWRDGPMNPAAPCHSCHMPPDPNVTNAADQQIFDAGTVGFVSGWLRAPGAVRKHAWYGPRQPESGMLQLAASLFIDKEVANGELTARVTTKNVGPGHAIPTGEPMRSLLLLVEARCDGDLLAPSGGDVVPDYGGALATQEASEDWSLWPGAEPGQIVRVVERTGAWRDYTGYGPFGDGTFDAVAKGVEVEQYVGESVIESVDGDLVTFDVPLPEGDIAYLVEPAGHPSDGDDALARAGAPGFGFARVLGGVGGARMVPHFAAVDVLSDNRLLPQQEWTSVHRFAATCAEPTVQATLVHRAYPLPLARERGWDLIESVMVEVVR